MCKWKAFILQYLELTITIKKESNKDKLIYKFSKLRKQEKAQTVIKGINRQIVCISSRFYCCTLQANKK